MTAAALPRDREASAEAGMNGHIAKPIDPDLLLNTLLQWIEPRAQPVSRPIPQATSASFPLISGIDSRQASLRLTGNLGMFRSLLAQVSGDYANAVAAVREALRQQA